MTHWNIDEPTIIYSIKHTEYIYGCNFVTINQIERALHVENINYKKMYNSVQRPVKTSALVLHCL